MITKITRRRIKMNKNIRRAQWLQRLFPADFAAITINDFGIMASGKYSAELIEKYKNYKFDHRQVVGGHILKRGPYEIILI